MNLIFVRHGIAEDKDLGKPDEERELTEQGRQELKDAAPHLAAYLNGKTVRLITSPLVRAVQTAEILKDAGLPEAEIQEFAGSGDFDGLRRAASAQKDKVHVIVGHSPSLDEWIACITDQPVELKKAAAALVEVTDEETFSGHLIWYLPAHKYGRLTKSKSVERMDQFKKDIEEVVRGSVKPILEYREIYLNEPQEVESVHKLRVKIRQFRSLLSFLKPLMGKGKYRKHQDILRQMAQECAYLRELDVIIEKWQALHNAFEGKGLSGEYFLQILRAERAAEQDRLHRYLKRSDFIRDLKHIRKKILKAADPSRSSSVSLDEMVRSTLTKWHDEIQTGYEAIHQNELDIIHALRIRAKKMRYVMEVFGLNKEAGSSAMYQEIKRWQEDLGNITDANRNTAAVHEIAQKYPGEPIRDEIRAFDEFQRQEADELYQEFFRNRSRDGNGEAMAGGTLQG